MLKLCLLTGVTTPPGVGEGVVWFKLAFHSGLFEGKREGPAGYRVNDKVSL